ncbi:MAG: DUF5668 domain-containing protein [Bryobacteraceae bacterium]|nr:DUF5668 domain-containing protein [Bryobacteraceae bacterium]
MNNSKALVRAARGPLLLITLGILMAADQMGGWHFGRTWPVLLIVFGVTKLLERVADRDPMDLTPSAPPGGQA